MSNPDLGSAGKEDNVDEDNVKVAKAEGMHEALNTGRPINSLGVLIVE
jgi:hypothetical protein